MDNGSGGKQSNQTGAGDAITRDEVFDLLSNHRRRYALHVAKQTDGDSELSDIAEQVAAWENGKPQSEITSSERHRVYTSMQQTHLPAMDRAGVIEYDNGTVTLTEQAADLDVYMDVVPEDSIPWGQYYLGLAVLSGAIVGAAGLMCSQPAFLTSRGLVSSSCCFSVPGCITSGRASNSALDRARRPRMLNITRSGI